jgi:predicted nucleic acid-binding protein
MGLILDSSILITAERNAQSVKLLLARVLAIAGNQEAAIAAVSVVELAHGIYRADTPERKKARQTFVDELVSNVPVYPFTRQTGLLAGKIDGEQQAKGVRIPFQDLLIGTTALELRYSVVTGNARHFRMIPNLIVIEL